MPVTKIADQMPPATTTTFTCAKPPVQELPHLQLLYNKQAPHKLHISIISNVSPLNADNNVLQPIQLV
jgi:hypothetical protein